MGRIVSIPLLLLLFSQGYGCDCGQRTERRPSAERRPTPSPAPKRAAKPGEGEPEPQWTFRRLGPAQLPVASTVFEVRSVLPRRKVQTFDVELRSGCMLDLGVTTADAGAETTFHVSLLGSGGTVLQQFQRTIKNSLFWQNYSLPVKTSEPVTALRLGIEGVIGGKDVWSRPSALCPPEAGTKPRLNVIVVSLDTLRADRLGAWGNRDRLTPNLDRIAGEGTVFRHAYATYPNTVVSHASLFTGLYPQAERAGSGRDRPFLHPEVETLAGRFAAANHVTGAITEDGFVGSAFGFKRGFDVYDDSDNKHDYAGYAGITFHKALAWLRRYRSVPFFLFIHTYEVHSPYSVSPDVVGKIVKAFPGYRGRRFQSFASRDCSRYNIGELKLQREEIAWIERLYDEETRRLDAVVGEFLAGLKQLGLEKNTLLVLLSDHGEEFSEHGFLGHGETVHRQALHVPLIFWAPDRVPPGRSIARPVSLIDVSATVAELAGLAPAAAPTPATSRVPWISGNQEGPAPPVFSELAFRRASCDREQELLESCAHGAFAVRDDRYTYVYVSTSDQEQLFDRKTDPDERIDLAAANPDLLPPYRELVRAYRKRDEPPPLVDMESSRVDEETRSRLEALGYVE